MTDPDPVYHDNIMADIVSQAQASLVPNMAEKYRCMVVWDTRINRDVGWVMVRKNGVEGLNPEDVLKKISSCQWRTWNTNKEKLNESAITCGKESEKVAVVKNSEEASTSTEITRGPTRVEEQQKLPAGVTVDRCVQVGEDFIPPKNSFEEESGMGDLKGLLPENSIGKNTETESCLVVNMEVSGVPIDNNNVTAEKQIHGKIARNGSCLIVRKEDVTGKKQAHEKVAVTESFVLEVMDVNGASNNNVTAEKRAHGKIAEFESLFADKAVIEKPIDNTVTVNETPILIDGTQSCSKIKLCKKKMSSKRVKTDREKFRDCPECEKKVRQKSLYNHLRIVHDIKPVTTICNVCKMSILEVNLLLHRKTIHPERFKSDIITCSACQKYMRALEFDSHECEVAEGAACVKNLEDKVTEFETVEKIPTDVGKKNPKLPSLRVNLSRPNLQGNDVHSSKICKDCLVVFADNDIKYHDCQSRVSVRIKKQRIEPKEGTRGTTPVELDQAVHSGDFVCEECGELFHIKELFSKHSCSTMFIFSEENTSEMSEAKNVEAVGCEQNCDSNYARLKLVVSNEQKVLGSSRDVTVHNNLKKTVVEREEVGKEEGFSKQKRKLTETLTEKIKGLKRLKTEVTKILAPVLIAGECDNGQVAGDGGGE